MSGSFSLPIVASVLLCSALVTAHGERAPDVSLTPQNVEAGSPELVRVTAPAGSAVVGEWLGHKLEFFRSDDASEAFALAGVDVETPSGPSRLQITVTMGTTVIDLSRIVVIEPAHYRTSTLTVAPRFVAPGPAELQRIEVESKLKARVFAASSAERQWQGNFQAPVRAEATDSFGTRRVFNGELASIHKGMDFRARSGTRIVADNAGTVVLARPLYYEGNCVILDHGLGLFTMSMHLSRIRVREGQHVRQGQLLGLSGATGRVTGPHLHWAVRWEGAYLDPAKLLRLDLSDLR
ncbi:MAG: M23 family metallopeptidase [Acidobacteriota bacterium]|nr:M23 family metallopeptidase [Acidobacteriota bacterium]